MALASIHESELTVSRPVNNQNYTVGQSWGALRKSLERISNCKGTKRRYQNDRICKQD